MSKCASCDQRNAFTYCPNADDMYCSECYTQKLIDDECYCDEDRAITCHLHMEQITMEILLNFLTVLAFVVGLTGFILLLVDAIDSYVGSK